MSQMTQYTIRSGSHGQIKRTRTWTAMTEDRGNGEDRIPDLPSPLQVGVIKTHCPLHGRILLRRGRHLRKLPLPRFFAAACEPFAVRMRQSSTNTITWARPTRNQFPQFSIPWLRSWVVRIMIFSGLQSWVSPLLSCLAIRPPASAPPQPHQICHINISHGE
jgi:hypothetical protein